MTVFYVVTGLEGLLQCLENLCNTGVIKVLLVPFFFFKLFF